jgi:D-glycero-alpha-D-manno-heptose-7-phosphate kinase
VKVFSAPLRVSFFGGGSDYPQHYAKHGGAVLSSAIDKRIVVTLQRTTPFSKAKYIISYSKLELVENITEIQHPAIRSILEYLGIEYGLEINIISDLPAKTGLGSSSSFVVALLSAIYAELKIIKTQKEIALDTINIEQNVIRDLVGSQDQVIAAVGGFKKIYFNTNMSIDIKRVNAAEANVDKLFSNLFFCYTEKMRFANDIVKSQMDNIKTGSIEKHTKKMVGMVADAENLINLGDLDGFGCLLGETWQLKKKLSDKITDPTMDKQYNYAIQSGALGGKLLGAGGGGFFAFYVPEIKKAEFKEKMSAKNILQFMPSHEGVVCHIDE